MFVSWRECSALEGLLRYYIVVFGGITLLHHTQNKLSYDLQGEFYFYNNTLKEKKKEQNTLTSGTGTGGSTTTKRGFKGGTSDFPISALCVYIVPCWGFFVRTQSAGVDGNGECVQ